MYSLQIIQLYQRISSAEDAKKNAQTDSDLLELEKQLYDAKKRLAQITKTQHVHGRTQ
mgnify:CR=1 FL=1